ncbi:glycosyltransferase [Leptolyngbya ohadii]|uniref:glycosyltransferase n=1 Tax=Leptolyngbya ohadii TaxID=1962290 RepID=UPI000B59EB07|nr:glycosyltransferase [Leptolyngbya ohadii]
MVNSSGAISQNPVKLHLGCGRKVKEGYLNIDAHVSAPGILRMDIFNLDFPEASVDEIFTEHMLEHLSKFEVPVALQEWARVLKPNGKLMMNLPNLEWCLREWLAKPESDRWGWQLDTIFGLQTHPGEFHKTGFTKPRLIHLLREAGFNHITIEDYWSHEQGCFWVEASKSATDNSGDREFVNPSSNAASANYQQSAFAESAKRVIERANYPAIAPIAASSNRPFWSVMIPVFNPQYDYLRQTIESVLVQAPDPSAMQIEVVDDYSTEGDVEAWVKAIGQGRVIYTRQSKNLGLLPNWNDCIQRAKGKWVHLLHQDDVVLPGFYDRFAPLEQNEDLGAAFCRYFYMDKLGNQYALEAQEQDTAGRLDRWLERISTKQRIQFVSTVVKRSTYETLGGYDDRSGSAADWEMWRRIAACYPVWYEPEPLACFRIHALSESSRLTRMGQNIDDTRRSIEQAKSYLPPEKANAISQQALEHYAYAALQHAEQMLRNQDTEGAIALIQQGLLCSQSAEVQSHLNHVLLNHFRYAADRFKPLRIIIDGVFFQIVQTGIARVWRSLLEEWAVSGFAEHLIVLDRDGTAPKIPGIRYVLIPRYESSNAAADRQMLQQICDAEQANLFISTYYTTPLHTPAMFMAYDMIPEVQQADLSISMWQDKHHTIRYADRFLAISENTARDLVQFFPTISPDRVTVAHCGVAPVFQPASAAEVSAFREKHGITKPYFLLVGMRNEFKNSRLFFQAFVRLANRADVSIVCAGPTPFLEEEYQPYVAGCRVHLLTLNDAELRLAYAGAIAFVYPSRYEGFGLPILEAMACGCPVITCNNSSIPEVAGNAALYVSEDDPAELAEAMLQIQQSQLRNRLIEAGFDRIPLFSWERMAAIVQQTLIETANLPVSESAGLPRLWVSVPRLLEQYHANPSDSTTIDQLRQARQLWLQAWMATPIEELAEADAGTLGLIRRSFLHSSFCQVELTEMEAEELQDLADKLTEDFDHPQAIHALLAMLLYRPVYQLPLSDHLLEIPATWREEYLTHLLSLPPYFQQSGDAEAYCRHLWGLTEYLHTAIHEFPDDPDWQRIAQIFTDRSNFLLTYFAPENLKDLYRLRAEIIEFALTQQGCNLDYTFPTRTKPPKKLRVGILANHFSPQTETFATLPVFKDLNRDRFETTLFTLQSTGHRLERYCFGLVDEFVVLPESLPEQVQTIRNADLDILFIASNLTVQVRSITALAAHRLARVQLSGMNSPVTTGMRHIDYYLTSGLTEPEQDIQAYYCETLIPLDGAAQCFDFATEAEPPLTASLTRSDLRLSETAIVYSSGANFYKITPEMMEVWAQIIAQVPDSVLVLYPFNQNWSQSYPIHSFHNRLQAAFARYGMGADRYRVLPAAPTRVDVKERLKLTDVYLDSYPFSGMTSLIDPLEMGIPAIVLEVDSACSLARGGAFLRELQVAELITFGEESYVQQAIELGKDASLRQEISHRIQQGIDRCPSFLNSRRYGKQMGTLFAQLTQQHQAQSLRQAFRLRETNLLACPDWNQPEEDLFASLVDLLRFAVTHPNSEKVALLISIDNWDEADANDALSSVLLYLLTEEGLDAESGAEVVLLQPQDLTAPLLAHIQARILLPSEDRKAIAPADFLPILDITLAAIP